MIWFGTSFHGFCRDDMFFGLVRCVWPSFTVDAYASVCCYHCYH